MANYNFVIDSSFQPLSLQELMIPLQTYKEEFEKDEAVYDELTSKADQFKSLSNSLPEDSKARAIYETYANDLSKQAEDFQKNGLSAGNRRALLGLKRRYTGEIGRLVDAKEKLTQQQKLRTELGLKDPTMLYASDNLTIDNFLDDATPNLYGVSGNDLRALGMQASKAISSRIVSSYDGGSTLGGLYRIWKNTRGISPEAVAAFKANNATIPELAQTADAILAERGVPENLTGYNLQRARQSVINGILDGIIYDEETKPIRDENVMTAAEKDASKARWAGIGLDYAKFNYAKQQDAVQNAIALKKIEASKGGKSGKGTSTAKGKGKYTQSKGVTIEVDDGESKASKLVDKPTGTLTTFNKLPISMQKEARKAIADGNEDMYDFYVEPETHWLGLANGDPGDGILHIVPRGIVTFNSDGVEEDFQNIHN